MKIALYVNGGKPRANELADRLTDEIRRRGAAVGSRDGADVLVALGGDGTILRAVRECPDVPVLGLNLGSLGYLASVEERDFAAAIDALVAGRYRLAPRTLLEIVPAAPDAPVLRALNDIVVTREMSGHAVVLDLSVDGHAPTRYLADGLILATPTGSTAYSLSSGGPVLMPDSASFVVTPMNPHALGIRPMVVSDAVTLSVTARERAEGEAARLGVYADGEDVLSLRPGETLTLRKSAKTVRFVELDGYDPYAVLAHKLGWSGMRVA